MLRCANMTSNGSRSIQNATPRGRRLHTCRAALSLHRAVDALPASGEPRPPRYPRCLPKPVSLPKTYNIHTHYNISIYYRVYILSIDRSTSSHLLRHLIYGYICTFYALKAPSEPWLKRAACVASERVHLGPSGHFGRGSEPSSARSQASAKSARRPVITTCHLL